MLVQQYPEEQLKNLQPLLYDVNALLEKRNIIFPPSKSRRMDAYKLIKEFVCIGSVSVRQMLTMGICAIKQNVQSLSDPTLTEKHQAVMNMYLSSYCSQGMTDLAETPDDRIKDACFVYYVIAISCYPCTCPVSALAKLKFNDEPLDSKFLDSLRLLSCIRTFKNVGDGCKNYLLEKQVCSQEMSSFLSTAIDMEGALSVHFNPATNQDVRDILEAVSLFRGSWSTETVLNNIERLRISKSATKFASIILGSCSRVKPEQNPEDNIGRGILLLCWILMPVEIQERDQKVHENSLWQDGGLSGGGVVCVQGQDWTRHQWTGMLGCNLSFEEEGSRLSSFLI
jgi:hypothetical protein